jgi:hypothetical protein
MSLRFFQKEDLLFPNLASSENPWIRIVRKNSFTLPSLPLLKRMM